MLHPLSSILPGSTRKPLETTLGLVLLAAALTGTPYTAAGQAPGGPFSTLEVALGGTTNLNETTFHEYWRPGQGAELSLSTLFYVGEAEAGAALHRYDAHADVPRFDALFAFVGWGVALQPVPWIGWYNGLRVGNYRMAFEDDTDFPGVRNESELTLALHSRLDLSPGRGWTIFGGATLQQTYTFIRLRYVYATGGIRYAFETPAWLQTFLK